METADWFQGGETRWKLAKARRMAWTLDEEAQLVFEAAAKL